MPCRTSPGGPSPPRRRREDAPGAPRAWRGRDHAASSTRRVVRPPVRAQLDRLGQPCLL